MCLDCELQATQLWGEVPYEAAFKQVTRQHSPFTPDTTLARTGRTTVSSLDIEMLNGYPGVTYDVVEGRLVVYGVCSEAGKGMKLYREMSTEYKPRAGKRSVVNYVSFDHAGSGIEVRHASADERSVYETSAMRAEISEDD